MFVYRCSLIENRCGEIDTYAIPKVCERFADRASLYTGIFDYIQPPLQCPIKKVRVISSRAELNSINLIFSYIFLGYLPCSKWNIRFKSIVTHTNRA